MAESDLKSLNRITSAILDSAIRVHKQMGPGLLEGVYQECLVEELTKRGMHVDTSVRVPLYYFGKRLTKDYIIDILVEDEAIVELKAIDAVLPIHEAQILSYLRLAKKRIRSLNQLQPGALDRRIQKVYQWLNAAYLTPACRRQACALSAQSALCTIAATRHNLY
jgi:GxxExxY protein